ncbi:MAG TPA: hypothetical protein VFA20_10055 [Myxococcaceae bacterium]|nr:hypothetical protein [Myxococcaceae bacterium]
MTRLLLTVSALAAAIAVAAGPGKAPSHVESPTPGREAPCVCAGEVDGGVRTKPHGLVMVAEMVPATPCIQGG